jgi:hypothetical protein
MSLSRKSALILPEAQAPQPDHNAAKQKRIMPSLGPSYVQRANTRRADATLSQAAKIPQAGGEGPGGPRGGRCAYRGYPAPKDRDNLEVLAAAVTAYFSDALMTP